MKGLLIILVLVVGSAGAAAEETAKEHDTKALMQDALVEQATPPTQPPRLPDTASEKAREAVNETAFGVNGAIRREVRELALQRARGAAEAARQMPVIVDRTSRRNSNPSEDAGQNASSLNRANDAKKLGPVQPPRPRPPPRP